jgi:hypothetical protein
MTFHFFKVQSTPSLDSEESLIKTLVKIRNSDYNPATINHVDNEQLLAIKRFVLKLGEQILIANLDNNIELYYEAKNKLNLSITHLFNKKIKFIPVSFPAQLLQYYTILSDAEFIVAVIFSIVVA